jgi:hypothetical protein
MLKLDTAIFLEHMFYFNQILAFVNTWWTLLCSLPQSEKHLSLRRNILKG